MMPTIKHGDLLIVDQSVTTAYEDGIYVLIIGSALAIKRIQRQPNGITIISDDPRYKEFFIPEDMGEMIRIIGKVLYVWSGSLV